MSKKSQETKKTDAQIGSVEEALSKAELFILKNRVIISTIVGIIIIGVIGYFGYQKLYLAPREKEATTQMFVAERYFQQDSLLLALNGDGQYPGFNQIIKNYGGTKQGNTAKYYAGVCYLKTGDYNNAISCLSSFKGKNTIIGSWALGLIGDAHMELGNTKEAISYYLKASKYINNNFTQPYFLLRAGLTYEALNDLDNALKTYKELQLKFPKSHEARDIERNIARVTK